MLTRVDLLVQDTRKHAQHHLVHSFRMLVKQAQQAQLVACWSNQVSPCSLWHMHCMRVDIVSQVVLLHVGHKAS